MIFDNHLHFGHAPAVFEATTDPAELARQMSRIGIRVAVGEFDLGDLQRRRARRQRPGAGRARPLPRSLPRLRGGAPPPIPELLASELERCLRHPRMRGIKLHPTQYSHPVRITDARYRPAFEYARDHGYPILIHTGPEAQRAYCGAEEVARVAREFPTVPVMLAHTMGFRSLGGGGGGGGGGGAAGQRLRRPVGLPPGATTGWWSTRWHAPAARRSCTGSDVPQLTFTFPLGPVLYADIPDREQGEHPRPQHRPHVRHSATITAAGGTGAMFSINHYWPHRHRPGALARLLPRRARHEPALAGVTRTEDIAAAIAHPGITMHKRHPLLRRLSAPGAGADRIRAGGDQGGSADPESRYLPHRVRRGGHPRGRGPSACLWTWTWVSDPVHLEPNPDTGARGGTIAYFSDPDGISWNSTRHPTRPASAG